ncbi:MAG: hypothetical protein Ct9H300mP8_11690 [Gammaproteobacteria bacterium]|nr:MAG: hypothetical protein Ct9H300mP8_11690 [Gammaproteobacteria bacterium]
MYFGEQEWRKIFATSLRHDIARGCSVEDLLPPESWSINHRGLYLRENFYGPGEGLRDLVICANDERPTNKNHQVTTLTEITDTW